MYTFSAPSNFHFNLLSSSFSFPINQRTPLDYLLNSSAPPVSISGCSSVSALLRRGKSSRFPFLSFFVLFFPFFFYYSDFFYLTSLLRKFLGSCGLGGLFKTFLTFNLLLLQVPDHLSFLHTSLLFLASNSTSSPPLFTSDMHRTYSMRQSRAPTASQVENPPPPLSTTKSNRWLGKGGIGE